MNTAFLSAIEDAYKGEVANLFAVLCDSLASGDDAVDALARFKIGLEIVNHAAKIVTEVAPKRKYRRRRS